MDSNTNATATTTVTVAATVVAEPVAETKTVVVSKLDAKNHRTMVATLAYCKASRATADAEKAVTDAKQVARDASRAEETAREEMYAARKEVDVAAAEAMFIRIFYDVVEGRENESDDIVVDMGEDCQVTLRNHMVQSAMDANGIVGYYLYSLTRTKFTLRPCA